MFTLQKTKSVTAILGTGVTNGATVTARIDRLGFDSLSLDVILGTSNVVSNKPSTMKLSHSDTTDATNFSDISGAIGGTDFTAGTDTSNPAIYRFDVDLRGRKRYILLTVTPLTTQAVVMAGRLSRSESDVLASTTAQGVVNAVRI